MSTKGGAGGAAPKPLHPAEQMPLKLVRSDQRQLFNQQSAASASPYTTTTSPKHDDSSNPPGVQQAQEGRRRAQSKRRPGALYQVPVVPQSKELISSAIKRASRVGPTKGIKNEAAKARNMAAKQLDALTKELTVPLGKWLKGFPEVISLHPFEVALLELTLGEDRYDKTLRRVDALRKRLLETGKGFAAKASKANSKFDTLASRDEGFATLETLFGREASAVDSLKDMAQILRKLPVAEPEVPTLVLVGAPNVGKSSLVRLLSSGQPEVQNYPFTTRGVKMGHFFVRGERHVVTDTPGLLNRDEDERNAMERLTIASVEHLPTCVVFVMDLTGLCGTTVANQLQIRDDLRQRFPDRPWLDVLSKGDLLPALPDQAPSDATRARARVREQVEAAEAAPDRWARLTGVPTTEHVEAPFPTQEQVEMPAGSVTFIDKPEEVLAAVTHVAAAVPDALRVSILTLQGVDDLKHDVMALLRTQDLSQHAYHDHDEPRAF